MSNGAITVRVCSIYLVFMGMSYFHNRRDRSIVYLLERILPLIAQHASAINDIACGDKHESCRRL